MKKIIQSLVYLSLAIVFLASCNKDEARDTFVGGTAPVLTASSKDSIALNFNTETDLGVKFSWTNPNYSFASGISSQNVNYSLEIDTAGANFNGPNKKVISISKDLSASYTQKEFNIAIADVKVTAGKLAKLEVRIVASLGGASVTQLVSNVLSFKVMPYAPPPKVAVPTGGVLYLVGDATNGGWTNPVPTPAQQFTKVSNTLYQITVPLIGGKQYLFIPLNGDWGHKFACAKTADQSADGGVFGYDFSDNFPGPAASGTYKISVDFQAGIYTVTKQ
jgi:hypothetical protein